MMRSGTKLVCFLTWPRVLQATSGLPLDLAWPVPFDPFQAAGDLEVIRLGSVRDLIDEGDAGPDPNGVRGLLHCVGGYGWSCQTGASIVLSIRRVADSPAWRRILPPPWAALDIDGIVARADAMGG